MADETFGGREECGNCKFGEKKLLSFFGSWEWKCTKDYWLKVGTEHPCHFDPSRFEPAHGKSLGSDINAKDRKV